MRRHFPFQISKRVLPSVASICTIRTQLTRANHLLTSSTDESCGRSVTAYPVSSGSNCDTSASTSVLSSDDSYIPRVNPSPIVSSLSSPNPDDGYCSPQVPGESFIQTSTQLLLLLWTSKPCDCHLAVILWCNLLLSLVEKLLKCQMSPSLRHQPQFLLLLWTEEKKRQKGSGRGKGKNCQCRSSSSKCEVDEQTATASENKDE